MLNCGVSSLWTHRSLEPTNLSKFELYDKRLIPIRPTLKPAFCNLYEIKSRKLTNWLKTRLFVEESCILRLDNSSIRASILVDERQVSRFRRPKMPCRALTFSSSSRAGASRSIVRARWQTGHRGYIRHKQLGGSVMDGWYSHDHARQLLRKHLDTAWYTLYQRCGGIWTEWHLRQCHCTICKRWLRQTLPRPGMPYNWSCFLIRGLDGTPIVSCVSTCGIQ